MPANKQKSSQQRVKKLAERDSNQAANDPFIPASHAVLTNEIPGPINVPDEESGAIPAKALPLWRRIWRALRGGRRSA